MHDQIVHFDLTAIAIVMVISLFFGIIAYKFRQPPVIGYIVAGFILGPSLLGVVSDRGEIHAIAELGIVMLLFVIGMELPLDGFRKVWKSSALICLGQILSTVAICGILSLFLNWPQDKIILMGFILALSSTALIIKLFDGQKNVFAPSFITATVGILIAQDIAFVPMILVVDNINNIFEISAWISIIISVGLIAIILTFLAKLDYISLEFMTFKSNRRELNLITGVGFCLSSAALAGLIGLSPAYGAFLAGLVLAHTKKRDIILANVRPVENLLMMAFFLSIGLLIDIHYVLQHGLLLLGFLALLVISKIIVNLVLLRIVGHHWPQAVALALILAQIGEFSLLLAQSGLLANIISVSEYSLIVMAASLSMVITSVCLPLIRRSLSLDNEDLEATHAAFLNCSVDNWRQLWHRLRKGFDSDKS